MDTDDSLDGDQLSGTLDVDNPSFTAAITPPASDGNRVDDTVTVTAYSGTVGNATEEDSQTFRVADAHALPAATAITVVARDAASRVVSSVSEGGAGELTISVDRGRGRTAATGEALSVALSLAPDGREPLRPRQGRVLEDRPRLERELLAGVLLTALPPAIPAHPRHVAGTALRAAHAVRPAQRDHELPAAVEV